MAIVTLLTDFGAEDHYVAAIKGAILTEAPDVRLIDISHNIPLSDISAAAYSLSSVIESFPEGSVHLVGVQQQLHLVKERMLVAALDNHYFVLPDNGLLSLISKNEPTEVIELPQNNQPSTFVCKEILAPAAAKIAKGHKVKDLGKPTTDYKKLMNRTMRATKKQISGHVIRADHYGNLITNIEQQAFTIISGKSSGYTVIIGRERIHRLHTGYNNVEAGELFVLFNSQGLLEIGINQGNAEQLLGLSLDSPVVINFEES